MVMKGAEEVPEDLETQSMLRRECHLDEFQQIRLERQTVEDGLVNSSVSTNRAHQSSCKSSEEHREDLDREFNTRKS